MEASIHDGHRERMRERIAQNGFGGMQPHEILEYLLYAYIPRKNTNDIAHLLIESFGSLAGVLNADAEDLKAVKGMTDNAALFLASLPNVFRAYSDSALTPRERLNGRGAAEKYMRAQLFARPVEEVHIAALDAQDRLLKCERLAIGRADNVQCTVADILAFALRTNAVSVLLAHNHPGGQALPSRADVLLTREIVFSLATVGVDVEEHFIFADDKVYSFEKDGRLQKMRSEYMHTFKESSAADYTSFCEGEAENANNEEDKKE